MDHPLSSPPLVLELDLTSEVLEHVPPDPLGQLLARRRLGVRDLVDKLADAARDPGVAALVAKVGPTATGLARVQEVRAAVRAFRDAGKPTVAWAESFGEFSPGTVPYYLASAFEEIWLQPSGDVVLTGIALEARFLRGAFDKAGITPQFGQRHEYKNAADTLLQTGFTPAHREALSGLASSVADEIVAGVAAARRLSESQVRALVDRAPLSAAEARDSGLVDAIGYRDEAYAALRQRIGSPARLRYLARYSRSDPKAAARRFVHDMRRGGVIGLVHAVGPVRSGRSGRSPLQGTSMGSDSVCAALRVARRDDRVKAVVLRVDSPGGSYVASDAIWREVGQVRAAGKPVVVSMGDVAASGGYFVAMGADTIVAQPSTITGSIGVLAGKAVVDGLLDRVGIGHDDVAVGERARLHSSTHAFTDADWKALDAWLDRVYDDFVAKVAVGRGMNRAAVHEVARGRVWTGEQARERGLVDELGGLARAVQLARQAAGLPEVAALVQVPKLNPVERVRPPRSSEDAAASSAGVLLDGWGPVSLLAARLGLPSGGPLLLPYDLRLR